MAKRLISPKERARREALAADLQSRAQQRRAEIRTARVIPKLGNPGLAADAIERGLQESGRKARHLREILGRHAKDYAELPSRLKIKVANLCDLLEKSHSGTTIQRWIEGRLSNRWMPDLPALVEPHVDTLLEILSRGADQRVDKERRKREQKLRGEKRYAMMRAKRAEKVEPKHKRLVVYADQLLARGVHHRKLVGETAIHFPQYTARQVRRILKAAGLLKTG
jgi:hypothetical protein